MELREKERVRKRGGKKSIWKICFKKQAKATAAHKKYLQCNKYEGVAAAAAENPWLKNSF